MSRVLSMCLLGTLLTAPLSAQGWIERTPASPSQRPSNRAFPAMCWDAAHGYVLLFGGFGGGNETWSWNGSVWTQFAVSTPPGPFNQYPSAQAMAFHPTTNEAVLVVNGATYTWNGANWFAQPGIIGNTASGQPAHVGMAHDPGRAQTVLYVGARFNGTLFTPVSETYLWSGFGWTQIPTATPPYPVEYPSMAFDPASGKVLLCSTGSGQTGFFEWTGTNWQQRFVVGAPASGGAIAADIGGNRVVLFDGVLDAQPNHTWTLSSGGITQLAMAPEPARRFGAGMVFDPIRGRTVMFGGTNFFNFIGSGQYTLLTLGDTWELDLGNGPAYTTYGAGCAGSNGAPAIAAQGGSLPRAGQPFQLHVGNLPLTAPTFLFFGLSDTSYGSIPLPLPLGVLGAPLCSVLSSAEDVQFLSNVLGSASWNVTIPNAPGVSFYNQAIVFDAPANALGITTSNGGHGTIGF